MLGNPSRPSRHACGSKHRGKSWSQKLFSIWRNEVPNYPTESLREERKRSGQKYPQWWRGGPQRWTTVDFNGFAIGSLQFSMHATQNMNSYILAKTRVQLTNIIWVSHTTQCNNPFKLEKQNTIPARYWPIRSYMNRWLKKRCKMTERWYPFWGWRTIPLGFSKQKVLLASTQCWASILRCRPSRSETNRQSRAASNQ